MGIYNIQVFKVSGVFEGLSFVEQSMKANKCLICYGFQVIFINLSEKNYKEKAGAALRFYKTIRNSDTIEYNSADQQKLKIIGYFNKESDQNKICKDYCSKLGIIDFIYKYECKEKLKKKLFNGSTAKSYLFESYCKDNKSVSGRKVGLINENGNSNEEHSENVDVDSPPENYTINNRNGKKLEKGD